MSSQLENAPSISSMRKVLARQHVSPDGLLTRFENLPFDQKKNPTLEDSPEELDDSRSRYFLDASYASIIKMEERNPANRWLWNTGDALRTRATHFTVHLAHRPADHNELVDTIFRDTPVG